MARGVQHDVHEIERRIAALCTDILSGKATEKDTRHIRRNLERQLDAARRAERKARMTSERRPEQLRFELRGRL